MLDTKAVSSNGKLMNLKYLDFFSTPLEIWYSGSKNSSTTIGFLFTLGMLGLLSAVIFSSGTILLYRKKPTIVSSNINLIKMWKSDNFLKVKEYQDDIIGESILQTNTDNFFPMISFSENVNISTKVRSTKYSRKKNIDYKENEILTELDKSCSSYFSNFNKALNNFQTPTENNNSYCIKSFINTADKAGFDLFRRLNKKNDESFNIVSFEINCIKQDQCFIQGSSATISILSNSLNLNDFKEPSYYFINSIQISLNQINLNQKGKEVNIYLKNVRLTDDTGFIMEDLITKEFFVLSRIEEKFSNTNNLLHINFIIEPESNYLIRYYMKGQELAAILGGILNVYIIVAKLICQFFASNFQYQSMINELYSDIDEEKFEDTRKSNINLKTFLHSKTVIKVRKSGDNEIQITEKQNARNSIFTNKNSPKKERKSIHNSTQIKEDKKSFHLIDMGQENSEFHPVIKKNSKFVSQDFQAQELAYQDDFDLKNMNIPDTSTNTKKIQNNDQFTPQTKEDNKKLYIVDEELTTKNNKEINYQQSQYHKSNSSVDENNNNNISNNYKVSSSPPLAKRKSIYSGINKTVMKSEIVKMEDIDILKIAKENELISKLEKLDKKKLLKKFLITNNFKFTSFKFILIYFLPCCVKEDKKIYFNLLKSLKDQFDIIEIFRQVINYQKFKRFFLNSEQLFLIDLQNKISVNESYGRCYNHYIGNIFI